MALFTLTYPIPGRFSLGRARLFEQSRRHLSRLQAVWSRYRTERALESLPYDMLKDIGFPSARSEGDHMES
jgi:hypothetical protein